MTRKHYVAIAQIIKHARALKLVTGGETETIANWAAERMREHIAHELADYFRVEGGFDVNGNRRFKTDRFMTACDVKGEK